MSELKPCPFCGIKPSVDRDFGEHGVHVSCANPKCQTNDGNVFCNNVKDWNAPRFYEDEIKKLKAKNEKLKAALRFYADSENYATETTNALGNEAYVIIFNDTMVGGNKARAVLKEIEGFFDKEK